MKCNLLYIRN